MRKTIVPLLLLSALVASPASANYFSNPRANVTLNIGSAPNPKPSDYRTERLTQVETRTETIVAAPEAAAERAELAAWLHGWKDDDWDEQMKRDIANGKLDHVLREVDDDIRSGRLSDVP